MLYVTRMQLQGHQSKEGKASLKVSYFSADGAEIAEYWSLQTKSQKQKFLSLFVPPHLVDRHRPFVDATISKVIQQAHRFQPPAAIIARKEGRFWQIRDKLFQIQDKETS